MRALIGWPPASSRGPPRRSPRRGRRTPPATRARRRRSATRDAPPPSRATRRAAAPRFARASSSSTSLKAALATVPPDGGPHHAAVRAREREHLAHVLPESVRVLLRIVRAEADDHHRPELAADAGERRDAVVAAAADLVVRPDAPARELSRRYGSTPTLSESPIIVSEPVRVAAASSSRETTTAAVATTATATRAITTTTSRIRAWCPSGREQDGGTASANPWL